MFSTASLPFYLRPLFFVFAAWAIVQSVAVYQFGIFTTLEAAKYIDQANHLLHTGSFSSGNFLLYSTQILIIAACLKLGISLWVVIILQLIASAVSLYLFYKIVLRTTQKVYVALIASLMLAIMFYYQVYNTYLYTESLFFSLSIIFAYHLFSAKQPTARFWLLTGLLLIVLCFTRPTGILFIPPTLLFLIYRFIARRALLISLLLLVAGLVGFYFILNTSLDSGGELDFLLPFNQEHVICGVPTIATSHDLRLPVNQNSVAGLYHIIVNNPKLVVSLMSKRFFTFWGVQRAFYSTAHNVFVALYFYPLYLLILTGFRRMLKNLPAQVIFLSSYVLLTMLTVLFSCDEWHSRFLYAILPFLLLLSCGPFVPSKKPLPKN